MAKNQAMADAFQRLGKNNISAMGIIVYMNMRIVTYVSFLWIILWIFVVIRNQTELGAFILGFRGEELVCYGDGGHCVFHLHCSAAV